MDAVRAALVSAPAPAAAASAADCTERYAAEAESCGARVLCFPEAFLTGYGTDEGHLQRALSRHSEVIREVGAIAVRHRLDLLAGFIEVDKEGRRYITHGIFRPDGTADFYRKTHLGSREKEVFSAGNELPVFTLGCGLRAGIALCVENHYPEIAQTLSLRGAEVIFAPHAVPGRAADRERIWKTFIPARSYDSRVFMLCCNLRTDAGGGGIFGTGPDGQEILPFSAEQGSLSVDIDPCEIARYHEKTAGMRFRYYPAQRRGELYEV